MPDSRRLVVNRILGPQSHQFSIFDTTSGRNDVFHVSPDAMMSAAVSPDGTRLAYASGRIQWQVVEISLKDRRVRSLQSWAWYPAWSPSGSRYLFGSLEGRSMGIDDAAASDRFSRRVVDVSDGAPSHPRWSRDGARFLFTVRGSTGTRVMVSNTSGARTTPLEAGAPGNTRDAVWSPDGQTVVYVRVIPQKELQVARIRPGSSAEPEILVRWPAGEADRRRIPVAWSPSGTHILARAEGNNSDLYLMTADFSQERRLTSRALSQDALGFSNDSRAVLGIYRNVSEPGAQWQLWSVDIATGRESRVSDFDLPEATNRVSGFSLHPDGDRLLTSIAIFPYDIWMMEGFENKRAE
jgi:Tol biopolymer transport system component